MGLQTPRIWVWLALTLSFSRAYDIIPGKPVDHTKSICSSWGNFHYKTFDGVIYQFPGTCNYNLASHCESSYHEFSVHIQRSIENGSPVIHQIFIQVKDVPIELKRDAQKVNGEIFETPYFNYGVFITKKDGYTKVTTKIGLTLTWNQEDSVMLEVDSKYRNKMCGLCGDYNGIEAHNEFFLNDMPLNPIQFGNMQHINDPAITCTNVDESQQMNVSSCGQYYSVCKSYLSQSAFSSCQDLLDVSDYVMACMLDVCSCSSADVSCLCSTLTEYSRQCTHAGGIPQNWRTDDLCPKHCPGNMVYKESGSPCISSCSHRVVKSLCEEHDVDGCFCPDGTVWDDYNNAGCISTSKCYCKYQDQLYAPGSKILNDCEACSCNAGKWTCMHGICPKVCSIEGGAHFKTFDGKPYKFHGNCNYLLSKASHGETHTIVAELTPCNAFSRETCLKTIQFYTDDNQNVLSIRADGSVLMNELKISLPHVTGSFSVIQPTESNIFVKTKFNLQIQIYLLPLMQLYISMDNSDKNTFEGLCGNFNYIEGDDFITSAGIEESTASAFANTWKIQSTCQDSVEILFDPCSFSMETKIYAENWCSKLRDSESPFWKCHFAVDPAEYYKRCEYDTCSCSHSEACMCATLSSYARACAAKGIILWDWRKGICDKEIPSCPASQIYLYNITTCQPSCRSLALGEKECDSEFTPIDGCGCPDGMYLNEKDGCVPISQCSCYHQGMYLRPNEVFYRRDERCSCHEGKLNCDTFINDSKLEIMGTGCISGCVCPEGLLDDGNGGCVQERSCPCSYNNKVFAHGSRLIEECKSCTCESGLWSCIQTPCYGTCTIYGSGHYITFDKKFYDFDGSCEFVIAQDYCEDSASNGTFRVITENIPCGTTGVTCSKSIKIYLGNTELKLTNSHMEKKFGESEVEYKVREVGLYLAIHTSSDISLVWDKKTSLLIRLPSSYKGKVCGLCGNYDDNANNDFLTSQLIQASNVMPFGNSWKRSNDCPDSISIPQPCLAAPHRRSWAEKKCEIITNEVFRSCHSKVDPKPFYDACVNDVCSCDTGGDCECFCTAVAAYAQLCSKADVCVHWRTPEICPIFCDYYNTDENECMWHYFSCGPEDRSNHHHITKYCSSPPITHLEGCYPTCPTERPFYDEINKLCVSHCSCIINNNTYSIGQHIPNPDRCQICECGEDLQMRCSRDSKEKECRVCKISGRTYKIHEAIPSDSKCFRCKCGEDLQKQCSRISNSKEKECEDNVCTINGRTYKVHEPIPSHHRCIRCECGKDLQMHCNRDSDSREEECNFCNIDGRKYRIHEPVPSHQRCMRCVCGEDLQKSCSRERQCEPLCNIDGMTYRIHEPVPSHSRCFRCKCGEDLQKQCSRVPDSKEKECIEDFCTIDGKKYKIHEPIPSYHRCIRCECGKDLQKHCSRDSDSGEEECNFCNIDGRKYRIYEPVPSHQRCMTCECGEDLQKSCSRERQCEPLCNIDGMTYRIHEPVPSHSRCFRCKCGEDLQKQCSRVPDSKEKECIEDFCTIDGKKYKIHESIPSYQRCIRCECGKDLQMHCSRQSDSGEEECNFCNIDGRKYQIHEPVPSHHRCIRCECGEDLQKTCSRERQCDTEHLCNIDGMTYRIHEPVPSHSRCFRCKCGENLQKQCSRVPDSKEKECIEDFCTIDGKKYKIHEPIPSHHRCIRW
ncbi:mucin-2 [Xenopus tropicalis]|uniref:von Willebrand factor n=1 Tax=Xenopus tropicalis TaxID=8364 RepID=A0A8J1JH18_XENTR|nr:mucin-2 [Xenopus tropicalis]